MGKQETIHICGLCEREVRQVNKHHLIPKSEGGREVIELCFACHKTLHSFFTNGTLATELNSIATLRQNPQIAQYLKWVRKQRDSRIQVARSRNRR